MTQLYPPMVDVVKSTNGHLLNYSPMVDSADMTDRPDYSYIGVRLTAIREGFSTLKQKPWAEKHGFSNTQWNNWENGTRRISVDAAERLSDDYGLTLDYIYRGRRDGLSENALKAL